MDKDLKFELIADYRPTGDQPEAIARLNEGIEQGLAHQTLLGVTGSGKSVGYDDELLIIESKKGELQTRLVKAGPFIDELVEREGTQFTNASGDTEIYANSKREFYTHAYHPLMGRSGFFRVGALLRHRAPNDMFQLTTRCGRAVTLTGDHNLWVLRNGSLRLIKTAETQDTDYIPVPDRIAQTGDLRRLNILPYLAGSGLSVFAEKQVLEYVAANGIDEFVATMREADRHPYAKLHAMRHGMRGSGLKVEHYLRLLERTKSLGSRRHPIGVTVGGKAARCRLPADLPLTDLVLSLIGYYVAEGNAQRRSITIANREPAIRVRIEAALAELGLPFHVRASSDYQVSSTALTRFLARTCGHTAREKRLPDFWTDLSNERLGALLRAYFDGDGTVSSNEVSATTASEDLAIDLAYALKRFGVHARLRRVWKRATNSSHAGDWYFHVVVSGGDDLHQFSHAIDFDHPEKRERLKRLLRRNVDTNVNVVPLSGTTLRALREELGLTRKRLAKLVGCSRPMISLVDAGLRKPSRPLLSRILLVLESVARGHALVSLDWWSRLRRARGLCEMRWTRVKTLNRIEYPHPYVYDLSVPAAETFLAGAGGLIVHNTFSVANVIATQQRPTLVLAHNKTLAAQLYGEFKEFFPKNAVEYFVSYYDYYQPEAYVPSSDTYIEKDASINEHIEQMRLSATKALLERSDSIVVATVSAIYGLGDPEAYLAMVLHLVRGDIMDQRKLLRRLADMQYTRNELDLRQGTYRVRGDVIDVFPAEAEREAVRIELFDDRIETLSMFDPLTGEVTRKVPRLTVFPGTHYVTPKERLIGAIDQIKDELRGRLAELRGAGKLLEAQRLEQRTLFDLEMMNEVGYCNGIENYSRYLSGRQPGEPPPCMFDYLPRNSLLIVDESHQTIPQLGGMYRGDRSRKETLVEYGFRLPSALDNRPLRFDEWEKLAPQMIFVSATPGPYEKQKSGQIVEQVVRPTGLVDPHVEIRPVRTQVDDVLSEITATVAKGERVLITTLTKRMAEDLTEYLHEHGVKVRYLHADIETVERTELIRDLRLGKFDVLVGINLLREGLDMPEVSLVAILDADKEGFLRSEGSLIQTIGRAARNLGGRAILYADQVTGSIQRAVEETNRRRQKQVEYNEKHGITPRGIVKSVPDIMEGARAVPGAPGGKMRRVAEPQVAYERLTPEQAFKRIKKLEQEMFRLARNLEFEQAARIRDEIAILRKAELGLAGPGAPGGRKAG